MVPEPGESLLLLKIDTNSTDTRISRLFVGETVIDS